MSTELSPAGMQQQKSLMDPGAIIAGRYEVIRTLGNGGMGTVLEVHDKALDNEVLALKLLFPHLATDKTSFARFRNEVLIARRLSHPNIVRLYDIGNAGGGHYYISMEFVPGGSLTSLIRNNRREVVPFEEILRILKEICCGIAHAHRQGVVHRDLKPDNILLTNARQVKITDFGLARTISDDKGFTKTGEAVGTPYYMAPEQLRGEVVDARCDIYALGILAYELVTGRRPFFEESYLQLAALHLNEPIPRFATPSSGIPAWYEKEFVDRCSAKDPDKRFQSADEVEAFLEEKLCKINGTNTRVRRTPAVMGLYGKIKRKRPSFMTTVLGTAVLVFFMLILGGKLINSFPVVKTELLGFFRKIPALGSLIVDPQELEKGVLAGDLTRVQELLDYGIDPNLETQQGEPILIFALKKQQWEIAKALLRAGASGQVKAKDNSWAVHWAARSPDADVLRDLINARADFDRQDEPRKFSPLFYAVESGNLDVLQIILDHSKTLDARDAEGRNALMYAIEQGQLEAFNILINRGVPVNTTDRKGRHTLWYAVQKSPETYTRAVLEQLPAPSRLSSVEQQKTAKIFDSAMKEATSVNRKLLKAKLNE